jgi:poly(3-hydroxybutyrate) depolymerase
LDQPLPVFRPAETGISVATPAQVLDAAKYIETAREKVVSRTAPGGHIGLFMGART